MKCTYKLGKLEFESELELDEYILNTKELYDKYGDIVFSMKDILNKTRDILLESNKKKEQLYKEGKIKREAKITGFSEDYYQVEKPYVGVNSFLNAYKRTTVGLVGHPLFPIFDIDNFILHKAKDWKSLEYWDNIADKLEIIDVFGEGQTPKPVTTSSELEIIKSRLKKKWKHLSFVGTAIHNAMNIWWKAPSINKKDVNTFELYLRSELSGKVPGSNKLYTDIIPDYIWSLISEHCFNIEKELKRKFGHDITFLSEIGLVSEVINTDGTLTPLVGIADLLILDKYGNIHIIDYKTSPKSFYEYDDAKKLTFRYQLATYRRMLQKLGFNLNEKSGMYVIPFQFENFKYDQESDTSTFDNLYGEAYNPSTRNNNYSYLLEINIYTDSESNNIQTEINTFLPLTRVHDVRAQDMLSELSSFTKECFPVSPLDQELTDEVVSDMIQRQNKFKKDESTDNYYYKLGKNIILKKDKLELIAEVKKALNESKLLSSEFTQEFKRILQLSLETGTPNFGFKFKKQLAKYASESWLENTFSKYMNKNWSIKDTSSLPILDELGIILVENRFTGVINVIKLSNTTWLDLTTPVLLGGASIKDVKKNNRKLITGTFESDIKLKQRPGSLVLDSTYGNIELMLTMNIINMLPSIFGNNNALVGEITVVNSTHLLGITASLKLILYNYRELLNLRNKERKKNNLDLVKNNFEDGTIKIASYLELMKWQFKEILAGNSYDSKILKNDKWKSFNEPISKLDDNLRNPIKTRSALMEIIKSLEENFAVSQIETKSYSEYDYPERKLYYYAHMAIAELDGVNFTQQLLDHETLLLNKNFLKEGLSGTEYDNPGNMSSDTLNFISKLLNVAYQNIRNDMVKLNSELRNRLNALKKEKNFGWIKSRTTGNQTDLYLNMYKKVNGDLLFKNPWDPKEKLTDAEREFLKFALEIINGNRFDITESSEFLEKMLNNYEEFFAVPLTVGSTASQVSSRGMMATLKDKLMGLHPKNIKDTIRKKMEGYLEENQEVSNARKGERWKMINMFSATEGPNTAESRKLVIANILTENPKLGLDYFERNLETIVLKHEFAYSLLRHIDKVFPTIKAGMLHLAASGIILNTLFVQDMDYLSRFIKNKIFNLSILDEKWQGIAYIANNIMGAASKLALAFNPRLLYLAIDGMWKDISLIIRKPDGEDSFTKENMKESFIWAYNDLCHFGDNKSLAELINELYGLNDMDINTLTSRMGSDNVGIWNFWEVGFRFASRPDFYNRLTIFASQMKGDGCFDAHSIKDGKLVYNWEEDLRFNIYAKYKESEVSGLDDETLKKYKQQKSMYIAMARQFMAEHAVNEDGSEFILDLNKKNPLPRAYTTQQSESMKSLSDLIYGYYSHEKKALIQSTTFGAMIMQMNTYWSAKKNLFLAPGGIRSMGKMELYEEDGVKYWHKLDENGIITNEPTDDNSSGIPYMLWKGLYQEGIFVTITKMIEDYWKGDVDSGERSFRETWNHYYNSEDENLRRAYRNNLKLLLYDLLMLFFLGTLVTPALVKTTKEHIKDVGNDDFLTSLGNTAMLNTVMMLDSSTNDFNMFSSIMGKGMQWTPFSITSMLNTFNTLSGMVTGERDAFDSMVRMSAATRTLEPFWDFVKISTLGRKIGDNGKKE